MRRLLVTLLAAGSLGAASMAGATTLPNCCACVPQTMMFDGGSAGGAPESVNAYFCAEADGGGEAALIERCDAHDPPGTLYCEANIPGPACGEQLSAAGIICPAAGAPLASPLVLAALALPLAGGGAAWLRRRASAAS